MKAPNWLSLLLLSIPATLVLLGDLEKAQIITATAAQVIVAVLLAIKKVYEEKSARQEVISTSRSLGTPTPSIWRNIFLK